MLDSQTDIKKKINKVYCEDGNIDDNSILPLCEYVIFPICKIKHMTFTITRPVQYGGDVTYDNYNDIATDYKYGRLSAPDLKYGTVNMLNIILTPIRDSFNSDEMQQIIRAAYP